MCLCHLLMCAVVRSALYRDLSDRSWLECVQGKSSESVLTFWIVNCLWGCRIWKLVCWLQRYVAVMVLQLAAMLWTHWAWTMVEIWKHENSWSCSFGFVCHVVGMCCDVSEECTASIFRVNECGLCVECEVHCCNWCSCESHYSQQSTSLLTSKVAFTISLLTYLCLHIPICWPYNYYSRAPYPHPSTSHYPISSFSWPFMVCLLMCPPPHSLLLALKRAVLEMLSVGSILTLYFSPSPNCGWSDFLQLSQLFFFQHVFSHWTSVRHREDGSSTFLSNSRTSTTRPFKYSTISV